LKVGFAVNPRRAVGIVPLDIIVRSTSAGSGPVTIMSIEEWAAAKQARRAAHKEAKRQAQENVGPLEGGQ